MSAEATACVLHITTPQRTCALTPNQQHETFLILEYARRDPECKVLVWTATGERAFSSGASFGATRVDLALTSQQLTAPKICVQNQTT